MSIMLFVILLHLLVARAINTRVESPPRLVLLTGRRYGFPSGNQSPGSLRSTSLSMAPELMATSFDSGSHWPSSSPSARATIADSPFGIVSHDFHLPAQSLQCALPPPSALSLQRLVWPSLQQASAAPSSAHFVPPWSAVPPLSAKPYASMIVQMMVEMHIAVTGQANENRPRQCRKESRR